MIGTKPTTAAAGAGLPPDETPIPLSEARRLFVAGRAGPKHIHPATITRWILKGVKVGGVTIRLEAVRQGGRWVTSAEACRRFTESLTRAYLPADAPPNQPKRVPTDAAKTYLKAVGWM